MKKYVPRVLSTVSGTECSVNVSLKKQILKKDTKLGSAESNVGNDYREAASKF